MKKTALFFVLLAQAFIVKSQGQREAVTLNIGDPAPKLVVGRWVKGEPIEAFRKDHVYVLDFWATWCVPCKEAMPHMSELARRYRDKATFIAMNVSEPKRPDRDIFTMVDAFVRKMGEKLDVHVAMDTEDGLVHRTWLKAAGLGSLPTVIIVDQQGRIAWIGQPRGLDTTLAAVIAGSFDMKAFVNQSSAGNLGRGNNDSFMAFFGPMQKAFEEKDYPQAISLYEKAVATDPVSASMLKTFYFKALVHVNPDKAYNEVLTVKGTEGEYELARMLSEENGLQKRFYDYVISYFSKRSEIDFFAMGKVAKAHFKAGDVAQAIAVQKQFIKELKLPTTPSTPGYIRNEEEMLKKYEAAAKSERVN